jgi:hypothetical protein
MAVTAPSVLIRPATRPVDPAIRGFHPDRTPPINSAAAVNRSSLLRESGQNTSTMPDFAAGGWNGRFVIEREAPTGEARGGAAMRLDTVSPEALSLSQLDQLGLWQRRQSCFDRTWIAEDRRSTPEQNVPGDCCQQCAKPSQRVKHVRSSGTCFRTRRPGSDPDSASYASTMAGFRPEISLGVWVRTVNRFAFLPIWYAFDMMGPIQLKAY